MLQFLIAAAVVLAALPAWADAAAGQACAKRLSPTELAIYRAAAPDVQPDTDLPDLLRAKVRPMVASGQMDRSTARAAAKAAGGCLDALRR